MGEELVGGRQGGGAMGEELVGGRPSLRQALIREAFTVVGSIPLIGPLLALAAWTAIIVTIRSNPLRQGKHDLLAGGTRVICARVR